MGMPLVCSTPACRRAFSCGPSLLCFGVRLSSQDLLVVKLSPLCWLPAVRGEREGLSEQRAPGCFRFHANLVAPRVLPMLQNGVSVLGSRWGGVGLFCARFALALQVAVVSV